MGLTYFDDVPVLLYVGFEGGVGHPVRPPVAERRIVFNPFVFLFHLKIGVDRPDHPVKPSCGNMKSLFVIYDNDTHLRSSGAAAQSSGRLISGCGQAGQSTAHSPKRVAPIPSGSCPRPARFVIFM